MEFQLLIKGKMVKNTVFLDLKLSFILVINVKNCWHFNIYEQGEFHAQLS